jgi:2-keto-4-pentenoate hydratase
MTAFDPIPAADALMENRAAGRPAGPLPPAIAPRDVAQGVAVQREVARRQGALPPGGFKLGATGSRMQAVLGLPGPAAGFMRAEDILESGVSLPFARFRQMQVECELAVRLVRDLPPGPCTPEQAQDAVGTLHAAIEIVENRYGPPPIGDLQAVGTPTLIADQVYHAACVVGAAAEDWRSLDLTALTGRLLVDGVVRDQGSSADLLGHPLRGLAWLAESEAAFGFGGLRAGQLVMLGSVTPSVILNGPCSVTVAFTGLTPVIVQFV